MKIESASTHQSLAHGQYEYPGTQEEASQPYDFVEFDNGSDTSVRIVERSQLNPLGLDCSEFNLDYFKLSEEEETLLDFLLPQRRSNRNSCIKTVNYTDFINTSLQQYQNQRRVPHSDHRAIH